MNVHELRSELRSRVDRRSYVIDGLTSPDVDDAAVYITRTADHWEVGVQERGSRDAYSTFPDEHSACTYALETLIENQSHVERVWWLRWLK